MTQPIPTDPNKLLERLRGVVSELLSSDSKKVDIALDPNTAIMMAEDFELLDDWIKNTGELPSSWIWKP